MRTLRTKRESGRTRAASRPDEPCYGRNRARCQSPTTARGSRGPSDQRSSCHSRTVRGANFPRAHTTSSRIRQGELQLSLLVQGGSLRSPRAARPRPGLRSCLRPAPARPASGPRAQQSAALNLMNRGVFTGSAQCVTGSPSTAASTGVRRCCRQLVPSDRRALLAKAYANRNLPSGDWVRRCCYRELCSPSLSLKQHGLAALFRWHG